MTLPEVLTSVLGVFAPVIIQVVTKQVSNEMARFWIAVVLSAVTGAAAVFLAKIPWANSPEFIGLWYTFASLAFKTFWKPIFNKTGVLKAPPTTYNG